MNYLAHAYLSFKETEILIGNMISDFVKGKKKFDYSHQIQNGIALHRAIDDFTDHHPATIKAKQFFRPVYGLYAGAFMDVAYDHFLALDTNEFKNEPALKEFSWNVYQVLQKNFSVLPDRFQSILPYMESQDWLTNCRFRWGLQKSFGGLVYRAKYLHESEIAFSIFNEHYDELSDCYAEFFPDLKIFSAEMLSNLLHA